MEQPASVWHRRQVARIARTLPKPRTSRRYRPTPTKVAKVDHTVSDLLDTLDIRSTWQTLTEGATHGEYLSDGFTIGGKPR